MSNIFEECMTRIGRLPHASLISEQNALRWVDLTLEVDPERILWHIARAGGVGGSEVGAIHGWHFGEIGGREGADRLGRRKLLMLPPDRANFDTGRGSFLEDHIKSVYEQRLTARGHDWRPREDLKTLIETGPHPEYPWLRASLDGVYEIDGAIVITDFKAPSEDSLQEYLRHLDFGEYRAQLNHYALVAGGKGVHVDALSLVMYDYRRVSTEGVRVFPVEISPQLQSEIIESTRVFWNEHVMLGVIPEVKNTPLLKADVPPEIESIARCAVVMKMAADKLTNEYHEAQSDIAHWIRETGELGGGMLPLGSFDNGAKGFLEVKATRVMDTKLAVQRLLDLGVPASEIEDMRKPAAFEPKKVQAAYDAMLRLMAKTSEAMKSGIIDQGLAEEIDLSIEEAPVKEAGDYDPDKLTKKLVELGDSVYNISIEKISSGLPRGKRQDVAERRDLVALEVDNLVGILVACKQAEDISNVASPDGPTTAP